MEIKDIFVGFVFPNEFSFTNLLTLNRLSYNAVTAKELIKFINDGLCYGEYGVSQDDKFITALFRNEITPFLINSKSTGIDKMKTYMTINPNKIALHYKNPRIVDMGRYNKLMIDANVVETNNGFTEYLRSLGNNKNINIYPRFIHHENKLNVKYIALDVIPYNEEEEELIKADEYVYYMYQQLCLLDNIYNRT